MLTIEDLSRQVNQLNATLNAQTKLIGHLVGQSTMNKARLEIVIDLIGDLLLKHDVPKEDTAKKCAELFGRLSSLAQQECQQILLNSCDAKSSGRINPTRN